MAVIATPAPVLDLRNGDQVVAQAIGSLPSELSDRSDSNPAVVLIEATGSFFDKLIYQLNRWPQSVVQKLLSLIGITLLPATGAVVPQTFVLSAPQATDTTIPKSTGVATADGTITFATLSDLVITAFSAGSGTAALVAGSTTVTGTSTSFVTGATWVGWQIQIPAQTGAWYTIASVATSTSLSLTTGALATVAASAFNVGAVTGTISAQCTVVGSATNIGAGKLTTLSSAPAGVSSTFNSTAATGGADLETLPAVILRAPTAFASRDVATSIEDYAYFARVTLGNGGRAKAKANTYETAPTGVVTATPGYVTVGMLSPAWSTASAVSTLERASVIRDLTARSFVGATIIDVAANIQTLTPTVLLYRRQTSDENTVRANVGAALNAYLNPNVYEWGRTVFLPDLVSAVKSAVGVDRVEEINGVSCATAGATTTTTNPVTFVGGTSTATGTAGDFAAMVPNRSILIDPIGKAAYLVTSNNGAGVLTITPPFVGASVSQLVTWFSPGDTALTNWYSLPYCALSTATATPPATIFIVGAV